MMQEKPKINRNQILLLQYPVLSFIGVVMTLVSIGLYLNGCFLPFLEVDKFWIFVNKVSLYSSIVTLYKTHNDFLGTIIFVFSVIVPVGKFILLLGAPILFKPMLGRKLLYKAESIGKWAMVDVFVLAVIVVALKLGAIVEVKVHMGVIYFSASILMTMFLVRYYYWLSNKAFKAELNELESELNG